MKRIVLISCVSKKMPYKAKAKGLYISTLFKLNFKYAKSLNPDKIFILSAKYGLLNPEQEIEPYNETLNTKSTQEIKNWSQKVLIDLKKQTDFENDEFIFLAGTKYRKFLTSHIKNYKVPLEGLTIGRQLSLLKGLIIN
jgi:cytoplasmic iron level regulating protein YaaA (DUF328/UPF0246 family)